MGFYHVAEKRTYHDNELFVLTPRVPVQRCDLIVFVLRDFSRVFVGGGQWGFDSLAREADAVEIEALAERFGWPELHRVLDQLETSPAADAPRDNQSMQRTVAAEKPSWLRFFRRGPGQ